MCVQRAVRHQSRPPVTAAADAKPSGDWTIVTRDDGAGQWAEARASRSICVVQATPSQAALRPGVTTSNNVWHVVKDRAHRLAADIDARTTPPHPDLVAALPRLQALCARADRRCQPGADDLVQDTLARAWEKRQLWQAGSDLRAWLFSTIMHNVHVNLLPVRRRRTPAESSLWMRMTVLSPAGGFRRARPNPTGSNWRK